MHESKKKPGAPTILEGAVIISIGFIVLAILAMTGFDFQGLLEIKTKEQARQFGIGSLALLLVPCYFIIWGILNLYASKFKMYYD